MCRPNFSISCIINLADNSSPAQFRDILLHMQASQRPIQAQKRHAIGFGLPSSTVGKIARFASTLSVASCLGIAVRLLTRQSRYLPADPTLPVGQLLSAIGAQPFRGKRLRRNKPLIHGSPRPGYWLALQPISPTIVAGRRPSEPMSSMFGLPMWAP